MNDASYSCRSQVLARCLSIHVCIEQRELLIATFLQTFNGSNLLKCKQSPRPNVQSLKYQTLNCPLLSSTSEMTQLKSPTQLFSHQTEQDLKLPVQLDGVEKPCSLFTHYLVWPAISERKSQTHSFPALNGKDFLPLYC